MASITEAIRAVWIVEDPALSEQVHQLLADPAPLRDWLTDDCGECAGYTRSARMCPLAAFLNDALGTEMEPAVYSKDVVVYGREGVLVRGEYPLPAWAIRFREAVDTDGSLGSALLDPVPRDRALALLDEVLATPKGEDDDDC